MRASVGVCSCPDALPSRSSHVNQVLHTLSPCELAPSEPAAVHSTTRLHCRLPRPPPQSAHTGLSCSLRYSFPVDTKPHDASFPLPVIDSASSASRRERFQRIQLLPPAHSRLLTTPGAGRYPQSLSSTPAHLPNAVLPVKIDITREEVNVPWTRIGGI